MGLLSPIPKKWKTRPLLIIPTVFYDCSFLPPIIDQLRHLHQSIVLILIELQLVKHYGIFDQMTINRMFVY